VLRSVYILVTTVMELFVDEIGAWRFYGTVDDWKIPSLAMEIDRLGEIVMGAIRHGRLGQKIMRQSPSYNPEVVTLTLYLVNSRHTFKRLVVGIVLAECRRLELLAYLLLNPIEQMLSGSLNFLKMGRQLLIFVWDEMHIGATRHSKPGTCI